MVTENVKRVKRRWHCHQKFGFVHFLSSLIKLEKDWNLNFRSIFNDDFTNQGYLHCTVLKLEIQFYGKKSPR